MINYSLLSEAQKYYESHGFEILDVPWTVSDEILKVTQPPGRENFNVKDKFLVASAEQSFLQLKYDGKLKAGKYQAITPCFRDEPLLDELHQQYFMKLELIDTKGRTTASFFDMLSIAAKFFDKYCQCGLNLTEDNNYDIIDLNNKIELGSYGMRNHELVGSWIYGTGLAEPRFSHVLELNRNKK